MGGYWGIRHGEPEGKRERLTTENLLDYPKIFLRVELDSRKKWRLIITSPILTETQIKSTLEMKR